MSTDNLNLVLPPAITRRTAVGLMAAAAFAPWSMRAQSGGSTRPRFHLTPSTEWINDPQRPLWTGSFWNLWVLWNGSYPNPTWGTEWRHYISYDLVTWSDQGISIPKYAVTHGNPPVNYGDVWTGSSVIDTNNTAGYGAGAIVALLTMPNDGPSGQDQSTALWYSADGGTSFTFGSIVQQNPHTNGTVNSNFRDPNVFWHGPSQSWVMSLAEGNKIGLYTSPNLHDWTYRSGMFSSNFGGMECPNMIQLHLYNADGSYSLDKWVLLCGADGSGTGFTGGTFYWVGGFDGATFTPDSTTGQWLDGGADFYATTAFTEANAADPLAYAYAIAWQNNWDYAGSMQTPGYWGQLSITRKLRLQLVNGFPIVFNSPIDAQNNVFNSRVQGADQTISDQVPYAWPSWPNTPACRIDCTLSPVNGSWPGAIYLSVRGDNNYFTQIGFQPRSGNAFLKRDTGGPAPKSDAAWNDNRNVPCDFSTSVDLSVIVDAGSIEVFLNGGRTAVSGLITAPLTATGLNFTAFGGATKISNLAIWSAP